MKKSNKFLVGSLAGVAAGAAVALILASKKGRETPDSIGEHASGLRGRAAAVTDNLREMASCPVTAVRDTFRRRENDPLEQPVADLPHKGDVDAVAVDENVNEAVPAEIANQDDAPGDDTGKSQ